MERITRKLIGSYLHVCKVNHKSPLTPQNAWASRYTWGARMLSSILHRGVTLDLLIYSLSINQSRFVIFSHLIPEQLYKIRFSTTDVLPCRLFGMVRNVKLIANNSTTIFDL